ncbi:MAG TPA: hypothetical protein VEW66_01040 [Thermomicrobiales bacterium]|nr:hypothetical protein [Thermomicrobiales bacterium]
MTENTRQSGRSHSRLSGDADSILEMQDTIEDLQSILDTLIELGVDSRNELEEYIEALERELSQLEALDN